MPNPLFTRAPVNPAAGIGGTGAPVVADLSGAAAALQSNDILTEAAARAKEAGLARAAEQVTGHQFRDADGNFVPLQQPAKPKAGDIGYIARMAEWSALDDANYSGAQYELGILRKSAESELSSPDQSVRAGALKTLQEKSQAVIDNFPSPAGKARLAILQARYLGDIDAAQKSGVSRRAELLAFENRVRDRAEGKTTTANWQDRDGLFRADMASVPFGSDAYNFADGQRKAEMKEMLEGLGDEVKKMATTMPPKEIKRELLARLDGTMGDAELESVGEKIDADYVDWWIEKMSNDHHAAVAARVKAGELSLEKAAEETKFFATQGPDEFKEVFEMSGLSRAEFSDRLLKGTATARKAELDGIKAYKASKEAAEKESRAQAVDFLGKVDAKMTGNNAQTAQEFSQEDIAKLFLIAQNRDDLFGKEAADKARAKLAMWSDPLLAQTFLRNGGADGTDEGNAAGQRAVYDLLRDKGKFVGVVEGSAEQEELADFTAQEVARLTGDFVSHRGAARFDPGYVSAVELVDTARREGGEIDWSLVRGQTFDLRDMDYLTGILEDPKTTPTARALVSELLMEQATPNSGKPVGEYWMAAANLGPLAIKKAPDDYDRVGEFAKEFGELADEGSNSRRGMIAMAIQKAKLKYPKADLSGEGKDQKAFAREVRETLNASGRFNRTREGFLNDRPYNTPYDDDLIFAAMASGHAEVFVPVQTEDGIVSKKLEKGSPDLTRLLAAARNGDAVMRFDRQSNGVIYTAFEYPDGGLYPDRANAAYLAIGVNDTIPRDIVEYAQRQYLREPTRRGIRLGRRVPPEVE